jgi:hypothetical protein
MAPRTAREVCSLLVRRGWQPGIVFYAGAKSCRSVDAHLIRRSLPALQRSTAAGQDVRALIEAVRAERDDAGVETAWRMTIDALRALFRTSPSGTQRERDILLAIAQTQNVVRAMVAVAATAPQADPNWLAVFVASGAPDALTIVERHTPGLAEANPRLAAAIASYTTASAEARSTPQPTCTIAPDPPLPLRLGGRLGSAHFWTLVDAAATTVDPTNTLGRWLTGMPARLVASFDRHFSEAMDRADTTELMVAASLLHGGCSDDRFFDFRAELILRGRAVFERVLAEPDTLADHSDIQGDELIHGLATEVYIEKTGRPPRRRKKAPTLGSEQSEGEPMDASLLQRQYPRLWARRGHQDL